MQTTEQSTHEKCVLYWNEIPTFHNLMQTQILKNELYTHISDLKKKDVSTRLIYLISNFRLSEENTKQ